MGGRASAVARSCFVYILECSDGTYYTGITSNLEGRVALHNCGRGAKYTRGRGPVKLRWARLLPSRPLAAKMERMIKGMTREEKTTFMEIIL